MMPQFKEQQKFTQWYVWVLLALIFFAPFIAKFNSILQNGFWGTFSPGIYNHIITIGLIILLFALLRLDTIIDAKKIKVRYFPFFKKEFNWEEIETAQIVTYRFKQVLGWGIRFQTSFGTVYNVRGYKGLAITLKNGKKYMIGTQKPMELRKELKFKNK